MTSNTELKDQLHSGMRVTWVGLIVNVILMIIKLSVGILGRSQALIADGIHSVSDLFSDVIILFGLKWGRQEEDEDHPFGHARIETVSCLLTGLILLIVGLGIAYSAVTSLIDGDKSIPGLLTIFAALVSIVLKETLYWYTLAVGRRINSLALIGNAWHHRSDALSSVAVLVGVSVAYFYPQWSQADSWAALVVTIFIFKVGSELIWTSIKEVVDTAPDKHIRIAITEAAMQVEGIHQVHDLRARHSGSNILAELHIVVDPDLTVREGHRLAKQVEANVLLLVKSVERVMIHVDPDPKN